ncbi:hypothetical protein LIER_36585 [Lithospermum erythrorhizon]|uniref:DUF4283 domain-containing protein n=1 Tax=Lithospermum erythrorhizon TaxID=34254 RepID=A0AAV3P863_LITER
MERVITQTLKDTIHGLWGGSEGVQILDMGVNLFHVIFLDDLHMARFLQGEPWLFDGHALLITCWEAEMRLEEIEFNTLRCWVQIWNLPLGYVDMEIGRAVGTHIGQVLEVDSRSNEQERGRYVRVRVNLNIHKPLKRGGLVPMRIGKVQIVYHYEKICDVCLYCGMLGHEHYACKDRVMDEANKVRQKNKYDSWILVHGE